MSLQFPRWFEIQTILWLNFLGKFSSFFNHKSQNTSQHHHQCVNNSIDSRAEITNSFIWSQVHSNINSTLSKLLLAASFSKQLDSKGKTNRQWITFMSSQFWWGYEGRNMNETFLPNKEAGNVSSISWKLSNNDMNRLISMGKIFMIQFLSSCSFCFTSRPIKAPLLNPPFFLRTWKVMQQFSAPDELPMKFCNNSCKLKTRSISFSRQHNLIVFAFLENSKHCNVIV